MSKGSPDSATYEVESILDKVFREGEERYLVRWKGYSSEHDTWEPLSHLTHATEALEAFEVNFRTRRRLRTRATTLRFREPSSEEELGESSSSEEEAELAKPARPRIPRIPRPPAKRKRKGEEDLEVIEVRSRAGELVWTVETQGRHVETTLTDLKRRAPAAVIDFLVSKMKFPR